MGNNEKTRNQFLYDCERRIRSLLPWKQMLIKIEKRKTVKIVRQKFQFIKERSILQKCRGTKKLKYSNKVVPDEKSYANTGHPT